MGQSLGWGRRYLMVRPDHFRIDYVINPYMSTQDQPDPELTRKQWESLRQAIVDAGGEVEVLAQRQDSPDMVYAMNLGLGAADGRAMLSHMRFEPRRKESLSAAAWFTGHGFRLSRTGGEGVGPHFESGDAFAFGDSLVVGYGPRTEADALKHLATEWNIRVRGLRIAHEGMYHLDLPFCPVDSTHAMVYPPAFDEASQAELFGIVPEPIVLTDEEAFAFSGNSLVVNETIIMPACSPRLREILTGLGLRVVVLDLTEFHKGGGSARCLTNPLDFDLTPATVAGGEVVLPA
ncbi:N-dimethylarginine dimethylaminohydrolase [Kribbella orskensis]|uniref:N-dimethylarginine dimethylaminohydrolase n=1 Tax=Kribbella orskensis TaxID=2512216 RepID=A0ABY2BTM4_9ACTN|nr:MULTISPECIES: arginine deiminase-related protein [Kribbella]TCN37195.1 N-dimethylarginine dimethylaminohydrolase [Kribbella sp. VKM Ac-2500]TCO27897.1 N-dimethylarginine dimethylaminohydrolase [Kribbella orskensis]